MCGSKVAVSLLVFLVSLVQITPAAFYHLDRFNRACIRNHGCDGDVVNIKMQVRIIGWTLMLEVIILCWSIRIEVRILSWPLMIEVRM